MRLKEILRLRQIDGGGFVPDEVLRQLELPMPDEVLEQFIRDHGVQEEFQKQYGDLDLHAINWRLTPMTAREFLAASMYRHFRDWPETVAGRTRVVAQQGWSDVTLPPALLHWERQGTWMRPPITLHGVLVKSRRSLHLVEGHTRFGTLKGLVKAGVLPEDSEHQVWIGEPCPTPKSDGPWREVIRREGVTFLDWLMRHIGTEGDLGVISQRLINVQYSSVPGRRQVRGVDLTAVLSFAEDDTALRPLQDVIRKAGRRWERYLSP